MPEELVSVPQDLTLLGVQELLELEARVVAEFDRINEGEVSPEDLEYAGRLASDLDRIRAEKAAQAARTESAAAHEQSALEKQRATLMTRVHGAPSDDDDGEPQGTASVDVESIAAAAARGATAALIAVLGDRVGGRDLTEATKRATASLSEARRHQPETQVPKPKLAVTASVEIPGVARGSDVVDLAMLADMFNRKAKSMPLTNRNPSNQLVATIRNDYEHVVDDRTSIAQVEELVNYLTSQDKKEALVAGGGWCAPSEIRYEFFNVAASDGLVDLPTVGISRGGIRHPVSPSLADANIGGMTAAFTATSVPWLWTEASDQAVTGVGNGKPCVRVPCPSFTEVRLECYGLCMTAGNLTDDAYPEATQNYLRLLVAAHEHARNGRILAQMASLSAAAVDTGSFAVTGNPVYQQVLGGVSLGAVDYRARYGMGINDVLEAVLPYWVLSAIKADLAHRNGVEPEQISDGEINSHFAAIGVRPQWVNDWQVRATGLPGNATAITAWPTQATVMIYAAGTFLLGNGLSLDLGVVRDSALNAQNDHTAGWTEQCHLVARIGHESRRYTLNFNVNGRTGQANITGNNL